MEKGSTPSACERAVSCLATTFLVEGMGMWMGVSVLELGVASILAYPGAKELSPLPVGGSSLVAFSLGLVAVWAWPYMES